MLKLSGYYHASTILHIYIFPLCNFFHLLHIVACAGLVGNCCPTDDTNTMLSCCYSSSSPVNPYDQWNALLYAAHAGNNILTQ